MSWSIDQSHLIVVDPLNRNLAVYDATGSLTNRFLPEGFERVDRLQALGERYLLEAGGRFRWFDAELNPLDQEALVLLDRPVPGLDEAPSGAESPSGDETATEGESSVDGWRIKAFLGWASDPLGEGLLCLIDVAKPRSDGSGDMDWKTLFARLDLASASAGSELVVAWHEEFEVASAERRVYTLGLEPLALTAERGYFLAFGRPVALKAFPTHERDKPLTVADLDSDVARGVDIPPGSGLGRAELIFQSVERSDLAVGIFAWEGALYLLKRQWLPLDGKIRWLLERRDPDTGELQAAGELPTEANHLTAVPGSDRWAFIEKGKVRGPGEQEIFSFITVPSQRLLEMSDGIDICRGSLQTPT